MKKSCSILSVLIIVSAMSGCVRYYKSSDVRKNFNRTVKKADSVIRKADKDYRMRRNMFDSMLSSVADRQAVPYPSMESCLDAIEESLNDMRASRSRLASYRDDFNRLSAGKKKIQSDRKEWDGLEKIKISVEKELKQFEKAGKSYQASVKKFNSIAKKYRVSVVETVKFRKKFRGSITRLKSALLKNRAKISSARKQISDAEAKGYDRAEIDRLKGILLQLEEILTQAEGITAGLDKLEESFNRESAGKVKFMVGPGMETFKILTEVDRQAREIKILSGRFNKLAGQMKPGGRKK